MDNEIKFVHCEETFNDHAVEELADTRALCICRLQFGRCEESECKSCSHHKNYIACRKQMNDYDRARLTSRISLRFGKSVLVTVLCVLFMIVLGAVGNAVEYKRFFSAQDVANAPEPKIKAKHKNVGMETEINVKRILRMTQEQVKDLNDDGRVDCIDHAVTFKMLWDKYFDNKDCMIVRNLNPNIGMAHLFVSVFDWKTLSYVDVEPWVKDLSKWQMVDVWRNAYDAYYNRYDETDRWLREIKVKIR